MGTIIVIVGAYPVEYDDNNNNNNWQASEASEFSCL